MVKRKIQYGLSYIPMLLVMLAMLYVNFHKPLKTLTVELQNNSTTLFFSGTVSPLSFSVILAPVQGIVTQSKYQYGQQVKKGDLLYVMESPQLAETYRQAVEELVKATKNYQNLIYQHNGNTELYKLGLISKIAYMDSTQQVENSELDLYESRAKLLKLYRQTGQKELDLEHISLEKMEDVRELLKKPLRIVNILAPADGILFFPSKAFGGGNDDEKTSKITRGANVKEGQTMAIIANLTGLLMDVSVNETDFHKLSIDEVAQITGAAFPGTILKGKILSISRQANTSQGETAPVYTIEVIVPQLTKAERQVIQVGMSAEVSFTIENPPSIRIPLSALIQKEDGSYTVKVMNKGEQIKEIAVTTGTTDQTSIQILKGLSPGDKIVLSD